MASVIASAGMHIPRSPSELTPSWLTTALQSGGRIGPCAIRDVVTRPLETQGAYGRLYRLTPAYEPSGGDAPRTIVAKLSSDDPSMRQRPNTRAAYEREVRFYQDLAPEVLVPVPICYYGDVYPDSGWHVLLLQDLSPARPASRSTLCSAEQARIAIRHIAHFHARWWGQRASTRMPWLAQGSVAPDDDAMARAHEKWWPVFVRRSGRGLPADVARTGQLLGTARGGILRHLFSDEPIALVHGDFTAGNLMFGWATETPLAVVDWQFLKPGRGVWDVACFLATGVLPTVRRAIEAELLRDYVRILSDHGVGGYSVADAMHDYRLSLLNRLGTAISTIAAMPFSEHLQRLQVEEVLPLVVAAVQDHDCGALLDGELRRR